MRQPRGRVLVVREHDGQVEAGELDGAEQALDRMRASLDRGAPSRLARATQALLRAKLLLARGDSGASGSEAKRALELLGDEGAPWWRAKAIRALERAGEAGVELVGEAQAIEAGLRSS